MKNRDCPLGRGICTEKLRPTFQPIGVAILFRSNLFPCNEFIPYDGVALGVLAVDVLVAFRGIESLGNIRRFCSALNPQISYMVCNLSLMILEGIAFLWGKSAFTRLTILYASSSAEHLISSRRICV